MAMAIRSSLRRRLIWTLTLGVGILLAILATLTVCNQARATTASKAGLQAAATSFTTHQREDFAALGNDIKQRAKAALELKLTALARLMAGLAATPILTNSESELDAFCLAADSDPDVRWVCITDAKDRPLSTHLTPAARQVASAEGVAGSGSGPAMGVAELVKALPLLKKVIVLRQDVLAGKKVVGRVIVVAGLEALAKQEQEIAAQFKVLDTSSADAFVAVQKTVIDGISTSARETLVIFLVISGFGLFVTMLAVAAFARSITRPIDQVGSVVDALATGDLTRKAALKRSDEIGAMADGLDRTIDSLRSSVGTIEHGTQGLTTAAGTLTGISTGLDASATGLADQASTASAGSQQVSQHVSVIAAGIEELGASVSEIAQSAQQAAQVAGEAVGLADATSATMGRLDASTTEIGSIVKLISSIAGQTNLLALNATIEAARAGEAGRGFAVVANEVKALARKTGEATAEIGAKTAAITATAQEATAAIQRILAIIRTINELQQSIASAVEEQSVTTRELAGNISEVVKGSNEISATISQVAQTAQQTRGNAGETLRAAEEMGRLAAELKVAIARFRL